MSILNSDSPTKTEEPIRAIAQGGDYNCVTGKPPNQQDNGLRAIYFIKARETAYPMSLYIHVHAYLHMHLIVEDSVLVHVFRLDTVTEVPICVHTSTCRVPSRHGKVCGRGMYM